MAYNIDLDIPNLNVEVLNDLQTKRVIVRQPYHIINQSHIPILPFAESAVSASYAEYANQLNVTGSVTLGDLIVSNSLQVLGYISASAISGSFYGDGSQLTGIATILAVSGSTGSDTINLKTEALIITSSDGTTTEVSGNTITITLPPNVVSSSAQIQLDQISGTTFANQSYTFPSNLIIGGTLTATEYNIVSSSTIYASGSTKFGDSQDDTHQFTGSMWVSGPVSASSFTGSFQGDGSQLTGLVTDLRISGSTGSDVVSLLTDDLTVTGVNGIVTTITDNTITIDVPDTLYATASIADNITIIRAGIYDTGSESPIIPNVSGGVSYYTSASHALFADAAKITGTPNYLPVWNTTTTVSESILYQTGSGILLGSTTQHTPDAPDTLGVYAQNTTSYNAVSVHGTVNNYLQTNIKNFSYGVSASTDIVATANTGTEDINYIDMGINGSSYGITSFIGGPLDAYLYSAGGELLIGNITEGEGISLFTGGPNVDNTGRMFISADGAVGINTRETTTGNPETLFIRALNDNTYNLVTAKSNVDAYSQINLQNESTGSYASSDIVATADNGNELGHFINIGINASQYIGDYEGDYGYAGDAYLYNTGSHLHIGNATPNNFVSIFAGGTDFHASAKLRLAANNQHNLFGNLTVRGSLTVSGSSTFTNIGPSILSGSVSFGNGSKIKLDDFDGTGSIDIIAGQAGSWAELQSHNNAQFIWVDDDGAYIGTNYGSVAHTWTFDKDGGLTVAGDIIGATNLSSTGSNIFSGIQTITDTTNSTVYTDGALVVAGGVGIGKDVNISGSLRVLGILTATTMSTQYVTSSQYTVGTSRINLNNDDLVRFAGLSVVDSGSTSTTGSLLWDSYENRWIYENLSGSAYNSAILIAGPKNTSSLGNEVGLTIGRVPVATGDDHIDTNISVSPLRIEGTTLHVEHGMYVTGSVTASAGFNGDGSKITGVVSSSYALTASNAQQADAVDYTNITNKPTLVSASSQIDVRNTTGIATIATTGSNNFVGNQTITGSLTVSGSSTFTNIGSAILSGSVSFGNRSQIKLDDFGGTGSIDIVAGTSASWVELMSHDGNQYLWVDNDAVYIGTNLQYLWVFDRSGSLLVPGNIVGAPNLATTGSNTFVGNQTITGSLHVTSSLQSGSAVVSTTVNTIQVMTSASYAAITPVSGTLYIIQG